VKQSRPISEFSGKYRFLSNFYPSVVRFEGMNYPTVEHAFQAAKTADPDERANIYYAASPGQAKRLGRQVALRDDWEDVKLTIMLDLLRSKFAHRGIRAQLAATGERELIEGNYWGDTFWGVCEGKGENHLGKLLMKVRDEIHEAYEEDRLDASL
jgi:ribA/ribD-fused uncharacterized protein